MSRKNPMGSRVAEGFACKPETADAEKPILFAAAQIFICDDERCKSCHSDDLAGKVRLLPQSGRPQVAPQRGAWDMGKFP